MASVLGALTVAVWFLVVDMMHGRPFHTPTVLGTALFGRGVCAANFLAAAAMAGYFWFRHPTMQMRP